jgi:hypothetical protein
MVDVVLASANIVVQSNLHLSGFIFYEEFTPREMLRSSPIVTALFSSQTFLNPHYIVHSTIYTILQIAQHLPHPTQSTIHNLSRMALNQIP